jgi:hypothetical protein
MITTEEYPTYCAGGKCVYPSRKAINYVDYENNINYDDNHSEVYGNDLSKHERFRDLGIPMFTLQLRSNQCNNNFENDNHDAQVISDEMFDKLYNLVAQSQKKETNDSKKNKEKTGPNTRKRKKVKK